MFINVLNVNQDRMIMFNLDSKKIEVTLYFSLVCKHYYFLSSRYSDLNLLLSIVVL